MTLAIEFPIDDHAKLAAMSEDYAMHFRCKAWLGQVGTVDGVHFKMKRPPPLVPDGKRDWVDQNNEYALLCMAVCNYHRRVTFYDISQASTTHDSLAWHMTELASKLAV